MPAQRILLMYISQVSGHRSAAMALEKAINLLSSEAKVITINAFNYTNPISEKVINKLYMAVVNNAPGIWAYLYDNPKIIRRLERLKHFVHKFNSPKLEKLFNEFHPDVVACTQAFPCGMVADYKKMRNFSVPLVAVLTDHVPHAYWIYNTVDYYIAPSQEVALRLEKKGIPSTRIRTFGIPFDPKFNQPVAKERVLAKLGLEQDLATVLIMGGGHGIGPMKTIVNSLEQAECPFQEIVIAGVNKQLYQGLQRESKKSKRRVLVLGYVDNIHELMSASDLLITKPGGITTAEALAKKIPMIIVCPIPGQEANNTAFLEEKNAAVKVDNLKEIYLSVDDLLMHPQKINLLRESAGAISKPNASMDIAKLLLSF